RVIEIHGRPVFEGLGIVDRATDGELRALRDSVAQAAPGGTLELIRRIPGAYDDRTTDRVAPIQSALRPFENFDLRNIEQLLVESRGIRLKPTVDEHRHGRLAVAGL